MNFRYDKTSEKLIISESSRIEYHQINIWLTRKIKGWRFNPLVKSGVWDGNVSLFNDGKINIGLWKECYNACKEIGTVFNIENRDEFPLNRDVTLEKVSEFCKIFFKDHKVMDKEKNEWISFTPYDYQIETAYKILKNRTCLAEVATSGGKSLIISIVFFYILKNENPDAKLLLIVPSINLVTQFYDGILEYNFGQNKIDKVGIRDFKIESIINESDKNSYPCDIRVEEIMSDKPRLYSGVKDANIYIGCYQSLVNWPEEFFKQFHTVVCDEAHSAKAATLTTILKRTFGHACNRFGVSGTFPPEDSLEILTIQSVLGPIVTKIDATKLIQSGTITPMNIKAVILNHNEKELNDRLLYVKKMGGGSNAYQFEKKFIQQSEKRLDFIKKIVDKCDKNTLILFHTIEYGQKILNKLKVEIPDKEFHYIDGEINNKKRNEIKSILESDSGKVKVLIASFGTMSTGISIKNLHYLILADSFKSDIIITQSIGRLLRLNGNKISATIFDLIDIFNSDMNNILYNHWLEREKIYKKRLYPYKIIKVNL